MKSQYITKEIRQAIWKWYQEKNLTQVQMAEILSISSNSAINSWLNGNAKTIRPKNWEALYPHIEKYLPADFDPEPAESPPARAKVDPILGELHKIWPKLSLSERSKVLANAAELLEKQGGNLQPPILDKVN